MDKRYELYCLTDPLFFDLPRTAQSVDFPISRRTLPAGWRQAPGDEWMVYIPPVNRMPLQGWKIHVSGCADSADEILAATWDYCVPRGISFKHLRGPETLLMRNAKYAPRGGSGKLVTIYPADEQEFERILAELGEQIDGLPGPYILSDLRIGAGPLYVRYGGFAQRHCMNDRGELVPAIEDGDGRLVPDRRGPVFSVPSWVTPPSCLEPHLVARRAKTTADMPYRIDKALHFSNGGGVYLATDLRDDRQVIVKEARPHAGLASDGADAVARLRHEHDMLRRLTGIDGVPEALDYFVADGHHFLVQELIEGRTLNTFFAERHPLLDPEPEEAKVADYTGWALKVYTHLERLIDAIHERGVVFNDLHMFNVMVRPDDTAALIDFEIAAPAEERRRQTLANPAFMAPRDRRGVEVDRYCLACLRLALFTPMTMLFVLDRAKAGQLADIVAEHFPVPRDFLDEAVEEIAGDLPRKAAPVLSPGPSGWRTARTELAEAIHAAATPDRDDRLFPGDIRQFGGEALGLAHGAAGVIYALDAVGAGRRPEYEEWLIKRACSPPAGTALGLYEGLMGAAYVLAGLGHTEAALKAAEYCLGEKWERLGADLSGGLAGLSLALDALADRTGETALREAADRAAGLVAERLAGSDENPRPGLLVGRSGAALMMLRRYERTGDRRLLDEAAAAIRRDLKSCVTDRKGSLQVDEGHRILPYVGRGSVGIGMVIEEFLALRPVGTDAEEFTAALESIRIAAKSRYYALPSLMNGRAGMVLFLGSHQPDRHWVERHVRSLAWHAIGYKGGLAFPGENLYRLSMDLSTGTAGVLLALGAALGESPVHLPFFTAAPHRLPAEPSEGDTSTQPERG